MTTLGRSISSFKLVAILAASTLWASHTTTATPITIPTVPVGNAGNANDPATGNLYGGVAYDYRIGTFEVTVGQYTAFLNAVAATDTYGLYHPSMATDLNIAGIARSGVSGSYTYSVIGSPNKPVTYVSWGMRPGLSTGCTMASRRGRKMPALPKTARTRSTGQLRGQR